MGQVGSSQGCDGRPNHLINRSNESNISQKNIFLQAAKCKKYNFKTQLENFNFTCLSVMKNKECWSFFHLPLLTIEDDFSYN